MAPQIERITESLQLGEGPHWDVPTQSLYFVDILGSTIHRYHPETKKHTKAVIGTGRVSLIVPVANQKNKFLISIDRELHIVTWDGESSKVSNIEKFAEVDNVEGKRENRINDGKCDPSGRLWAGTMGVEPVPGQVDPEKGSLFSFGPKGEVNIHEDKIGIANGLAWSSDNKKFYYIDSIKERIDQYDFDIVKGTISNPKTVFTLKKHNIPGLPDGMTIDTDGNLWVAIFNGARVIKIDPRKPETLLNTISLPAKQTTSVAFGGASLDELYVTSAAVKVGDVELAPPEHGATYRIKGTGSKGLPGVPVKL